MFFALIGMEWGLYPLIYLILRTKVENNFLYQQHFQHFFRKMCYQRTLSYPTAHRNYLFKNEKKPFLRFLCP